MKIKFRLPVVTGKVYDIEGTLTHEEANALLEFAFLSLLSRGVSPASIGTAVSEVLDEVHAEMEEEEPVVSVPDTKGTVH